MTPRPYPVAVAGVGNMGAPAAQAFADASAAGWQAHDDGALLQWLRQLPTIPP